MKQVTAQQKASKFQVLFVGQYFNLQSYHLSTGLAGVTSEVDLSVLVNV